MKTMGQAVDEALAIHVKQYPDGVVLSVEAFESELLSGTWVVVVYDACAASRKNKYQVSQHTSAPETV